MFAERTGSWSSDGLGIDETCDLEELVDQTGLGHLERSIGKRLDLDAKVVCEVAFGFEVEVESSHFGKELLGCGCTVGNDDGVVNKDAKDTVVAKVEARVVFGNNEANGLKFLAQVAIPQQWSASITVERLGHFEDLASAASVTEAVARWEIQVDGLGQRGLHKSVAKVDLRGMEAFCNRQGEKQTDSGPIDDRSIGFVDGCVETLQVATDTQTGLVLGDGAIGFAFAAKDPGRLDDLGAFGNGFRAIGEDVDAFVV